MSKLGPVFQRRGLFRLCLLGAMLATAYASAPAAEPPPNILFIMADDLGWRDTSLYGSTFYETPNIDALAGRGMRFTQAYAANPLCSPTRASIMTGQYPCRVGITTPGCHLGQVIMQSSLEKSAPPNRKMLMAVSATRLDTAHYTLAEAFRDAGYATGHFGKWHLGHEPYDPLHHGYEVDVPHWPGPGPAGSYVAPWRFPANLNFPGPPGEHIEDRMAVEAVRFLERHRDRPFFMTYWCFSVHAPYDAKKGLIEKYTNKADPANPQRHPVMGAMIESLDDAVGSLIGALDRLGLARRTVIVFFSDNGGVHWEGNKGEGNAYGCPVTSNAPLKGGKATIYEGGTREPMIVVWPGVVEPGTASGALVSSVDFYPTLLEIAGLKPNPEQVLDGVSLVPALKGGAGRRDAVFCHFPHGPGIRPGFQPSTYVRKGDWKLIRFYCDNEDQSNRYELYNLAEDIGESNNLAGRHPDRVRELDTLIARHLAETGAVVPRPNPAYRAREGGAGASGDWTAAGTCSAAVEEGALKIVSTGADPHVQARSVPAAEGPLAARLRMKSSASGTAVIYWSTDRDRLFHRDRTRAIPVQHDGAWHEVRAELPVEGALRGLRIDPATAAGEVLIDWVVLEDGQGRTLKRWDF